MAVDECSELKVELNAVIKEIERLNNKLNILYRKKELLSSKIAEQEGYPLCTNIEYLFSKFDFERSENYCSKSTVTRAKRLLLSCGYTDIQQLEGKKFIEFLDTCEGTKHLAVILAYCYKCKVNMDMGSLSIQADIRMEMIKYQAISFMDYIVLNG